MKDADFQKMLANAEKQSQIEAAVEAEQAKKIEEMQADPDYQKIWDGVSDAEDD